MNILLTSVGRRTYMVSYFKEALRGFGQVHVANSNYCYAMKIADKSVITPIIYDDSYIEFIINYCRENKISAIISQFDIDLPVLALNSSKLEQNGITVVVSSFQIVNICNDKWETYRFLNNHGFNTPKSFLSIQETLNDINVGNISFPLIVKPRWGMGSIGVFQADDADDLDFLNKQTIKTIFNSYLKYESDKNKLNFPWHKSNSQL